MRNRKFWSPWSVKIVSTEIKFDRKLYINHYDLSEGIYCLKIKWNTKIIYQANARTNKHSFTKEAIHIRMYTKYICFSNWASYFMQDDYTSCKLSRRMHMLCQILFRLRVLTENVHQSEWNTHNTTFCSASCHLCKVRVYINVIKFKFKSMKICGYSVRHNGLN